MKQVLSILVLLLALFGSALLAQGSPSVVQKAPGKSIASAQRGGPDVPIRVDPAHLPSPKWILRAAQGHGGASNGMFSD